MSSGGVAVARQRRRCAERRAAGCRARAACERRGRHGERRGRYGERRGRHGERRGRYGERRGRHEHERRGGGRRGHGSSNLVTNGTFDTACLSLVGQRQPAPRTTRPLQTLAVTNGQLCATMTAGGQHVWDVIIGLSDLALLPNQYYHISFSVIGRRGPHDQVQDGTR